MFKCHNVPYRTGGAGSGKGSCRRYGRKVEKKVVTGVKRPCVLTPRAVTLTMTTAAMNATKRPYSTAVAPRSESRFLTQEILILVLCR